MCKPGFGSAAKDGEDCLCYLGHHQSSWVPNIFCAYQKGVGFPSYTTSSLYLSLCLCVLSSTDLLLLLQLITNKKQKLCSVLPAEFIYGFLRFYSSTPSSFDSWLLGHSACEFCARNEREKKQNGRRFST